MSDALLARAVAAGLTRGRAWWSRGPVALVGTPNGPQDGPTWWWAPEGEPYGKVVRRPRHTEAEALALALDWIEAGEPVGVRHG